MNNLNVEISKCIANDKTKTLTAEASELELPPGTFPKSVLLIDGGRLPLYCRPTGLKEHGEFYGVKYTAVQDWTYYQTLIILND